MEKLIAELRRLYLPADEMLGDAQAGAQAGALARRLNGEAGVPLSLAAPDGRVRALALPFARIPKADEGEHWRQLCTVANAMQNELDLPAPGVSIDGEAGYHLWLSLAAPVPVARAAEFLALLRLFCFPEADAQADRDAAAVQAELPPFLNARSGKWAAFIHPGMGLSFADDPGLDMTPPLAGQVMFLEGLESIDEARFAAALERLWQGRGRGEAPAPASASIPAQVPQPATNAHPAPHPSDTLLLKDATLEDIVRFLHERNIEPTFRHLLPKQGDR